MPTAGIESPATGIVERLTCISNELVRQGLYLHEIEIRLYDFLSATQFKVPLLARRVHLFRRGLGLRDALPRREASEIAEAVVRALRAPYRDPAFERQYLLARLRSNLEGLALRLDARMRRARIPVTPSSLAREMTVEMAQIIPRSQIVPWYLDDIIVAAAIERVVTELASELYREC